MRASTAPCDETNGHSLLIGPQLGLIVIVAMEGVARNSALVDPAGCVKITKIDQHAHCRPIGNGVARTVVVSHGIHHGRPTADLVIDRD